MSAPKRNNYQRIAAQLRHQIDSGCVPGGTFLPSERELQENFLASRSTVRRALAQLVRDGHAQSIPNRGVIATPTESARQVTGNVALIDAGSYVLRVMGMSLAARIREKGLYLVHLGGSVDYSPEHALQVALDNKFSGAIIWPYRAFPDCDFVSRVAKELPIVSLDHRQEGAQTDLVTFDHEAAGAEATTQLIRQGCRRIAITGMMDVLDVTHQRFRGYMKAMFAHGLQPEPRNFLFTMTSGLESPDPFSLSERLKAPDRPDGLVVLQDMFVPITVEAVLEAGLSIPLDVKIATIGDDIDLSVDGVGLTAVAFDWETMANEALELLLNRIAGPDRPNQTRMIPHRLMVRGSCGAARMDWNDGSRSLSADRLLPRSRYHYSSGRAVPLDRREPSLGSSS